MAGREFDLRFHLFWYFLSCRQSLSDYFLKPWLIQSENLSSHSVVKAFRHVNPQIVRRKKKRSPTLVQITPPRFAG